MSNKKIEDWVLVAVSLFPVAVFLLTPAQAVSPAEHQLAAFVDEYLFGQGYYKPEAYPFAAKLTNSFSFILAVAAAIIFSLSQYHKKIQFDSANHIIGMFIFLALMAFTVWLTVVHQDFSMTKGVSFGTKASFHNNPVLFLFMMVCKTSVIYFAIRYTLAVLTTFLLEWKEYRERKGKQ
ncbi:hypothetical protein ACFPVS_11055 [Neisseria weixii]|uniref:hypothetical protein n=1 Tax=Neisseria weixii TaxID=1853276 RepID=UPI0036178100